MWVQTRKGGLVLFLICRVFLLLGQQDNIQPLEQRLILAKGQDRVDLLNRLREQFLQSAPEQSREYTKEAFDLSQELLYQPGLINSSFLLGRLEKNTQHYRRAARFVEVGLEASKNRTDQEQTLQGLELLMTIYQRDNRDRKLEETALDCSRNKEPT